MTLEGYTPHECVPWVHYRAQIGHYLVIDMRLAEGDPRGPTPSRVETLDDVHRFAADHSVTDSKVPVGDFIKWLASVVGVPYCGPCAKRRACLNQLLGKPW